MFTKSLLFILFTASIVCADDTHIGIIKVRRDKYGPLDTRQDVEDYGCLTVRRLDGKEGPPYPAVTRGTDCASFEITSEGGSYSQSAVDLTYRFKERVTGKYMSYRGGHWIYFHDEPPKAPATAFILQRDTYWNRRNTNLVLRPANSKNIIYAQEHSGDLNVKNSGFKMFVDKP